MTLALYELTMTLCFTAPLINSLGKHEEALKLNQTALDLWLEIFGEEHPDVAAAYYNIGLNYSKLQRYKESHQKIKKSFELRCQVLMIAHPDTLKLLTGCVISLSHLRRIMAALPLLSDAEKRVNALELDASDRARALKEITNLKQIVTQKIPGMKGTSKRGQAKGKKCSKRKNADGADSGSNVLTWAARSHKRWAGR